MLFTTLTKAQYDVLDESIKSHYKIKADGSNYVLDLQGTTENEARLDAQVTQLSRDLTTARNERLLSQAAVEAAEEKYKTQYEGQVNTLTEKVAKLEGTQATARRNEIIDGIANKFTRPELFRSVLQNNVTVEYVNGELVEKIVDNEGKAITIDALSDLYCKNKDYSAMLVANTSTPTFSQGGNAGQQQQQQQHRDTPTPAGQPSYEECVKYTQDGKPYVVNSAAMTDQYLERFADEATKETT